MGRSASQIVLYKKLVKQAKEEFCEVEQVETEDEQFFFLCPMYLFVSQKTLRKTFSLSYEYEVEYGNGIKSFER